MDQTKPEDRADEQPTDPPAAEPPPSPKDGKIRIEPPGDGTFAAELAESTRAFNRGDFKVARQMAHKALAGQHSEAEGTFARDILHRTGIDKIAIYVAVGCFVLFWVTIYLTLWR